jgi:hypothetical protein
MVRYRYTSNQSIMLHDSKITHERESYDLLDLFGDLGGIIEIFCLFGSLTVSHYSEYSYNLKLF